MQFLDTPNLEYLADDVELRRAAEKTLKGFCLTYLPHHFPADLSDFFDEMAEALQDHDIKRLEIIGFRGCAKSTLSYSPLELVIWNDPAAINRLSIHAVQAATTAILTLPADCARIKDIERGPPMTFSYRICGRHRHCSIATVRARTIHRHRQGRRSLLEAAAVRPRIDRTRAAHTPLIDSRAVEKLNFRILIPRTAVCPS
jgi:hypothetical protein